MKNQIFLEKIDWIIEQHESTNHMYDTYLPYRFHLLIVAEAAKRFKGLIPDNDFETVKLSAYGHDLIEDTRTSYNDVKQVLGESVADIVYALTNEKGRNRKERANDSYYQGIRDTKYAVFVKLCDRIANVQYSKMTGSRMFEMYKKENPEFMTQLGFGPENNYIHEYADMFCYLIELFETN